METRIEQAREQFNSIMDWLVSLAQGKEIHEVEGGLYGMLLKLGCSLLKVFIDAVGTAEQGEVLLDEEGKEFRLVGTKSIKYLSIFGEVGIPRAHYAREGNKGLFPLDAVLNLPERKYSYLLQKWMADEAVNSTYESASTWVSERLGLEVAHRPVQRVIQDCTPVVEEFMDTLEPPSVEEEGSILVHSVDGKGIPMRPSERNPDQVKTEDKPGVKRIACLARTYSVDPHMRSNEEIIDSFIKHNHKGKCEHKEDRKRNSDRPRPRHRRTIASLKRKKSEVFTQSKKITQARISEGTKERVVLMDGERALWNLSAEHFDSSWIPVLDFTHVMEKLRIAGDVHNGKDTDGSDAYVREQGLLLLEGRVDSVIDGLTNSVKNPDISKSKVYELETKVLGYYKNNRNRMAYDEYLSKGLPIASGIIESTCKTIINRRMEGSGMRWSSNGAEAMLKLRGVQADNLWDEFWAFRPQRERHRLYAKYEHILDNYLEKLDIHKVEQYQ